MVPSIAVNRDYLLNARMLSVLTPLVCAILLLLFGLSIRSRLRQQYRKSSPVVSIKSPFANEYPPSRRPFAALPELSAKPTLEDVLTVTGFTKEDVESLGRFPDYSRLSGVPHPVPVPNLDIKKATFRPFRPFRWAYHQTMGLYFSQLNQITC